MKPVCENKDGFWVKYMMECGRGHTITHETYIFYKYEDGYTENDVSIFSDDSYNWAGRDMGGFQMMRFDSDYKVVEEPSQDWLSDELIRSYKKMAKLAEHTLRLAKYRKLL